MYMGFRVDRWCPTLGILAVGVFAFGITRQDAPKGETDSDRTGVSKVPASPVKPWAITAGLRIQGANVPMAPPVRAYRTRAVAFEGRPDLPLLLAERVDERFSGIAAPYTGVGPDCELDIQCDDCDPCTKDRCIAGDCVFPPAPEGTACDDGLFCNGIEVCNGVGVCDQSQERPCGNRQEYICDEAAQPGLCVLPCQDNSDCDDGLWCTGVEVCIAQECVGGDTPGAACVTPGAPCPGDGWCGGVCRVPAGPPCGEPVSCQESTHTCGNGRCCTDTIPGPPFFEDCSRATRAACTGIWFGLGGDEGDTTGCAIVPVPEPNAGEDYRCPRYESGIVLGDLIMHVGPVGLAECQTLQEIGDDYELDIPTEYLEVTTFRFIGGFKAGTGSRMRITFYDSQGRLVEDAITEPSFAPGNLLRTVIFNEPPTIPSQGFVALRPAVESLNGLGYWMSTDTVSVGDNDPDVMWLNGWPSANIIEPSLGILAFEIVGEEREAPLGACCDAETGICDLQLPWVCEDEGGLFQGIGTACGVCSGDPFISCDIDDDCKICIGGENHGEPCYDDFECDSFYCDTEGYCVTVPSGCSVTACCDPITGVCNEATDCPSGTYPLGFGTTCDPNCCEQPLYEGYDTCAEAGTNVLVINVPYLGMDPQTFALTGDNKQATFGDYESGTCDLEIFNPDGGTRDRGWWQAFAIDDCAFVRIDTCCTQEITGEIHEPLWAFLMTDCDPCTTAIAPKAVSPPVGTGTSAYARGAPFCTGNDMWQTYGPLPPGTYYYPIHTAPGGHFGQYQLHITVGACDEAACCLPWGTCISGTENEGQFCDRNSDCDPTPEPGDCQPDCEILNRLDCDSAAGYWLGWGNISPDMDPVVVCEVGELFQACGTGSCCIGPGECVDEGPVGEPVDLELCQADFGGTYVGGALCDWPESPCPVCFIAYYGSNCQMPSESGSRVVMSDLSASPNGVVHADDFIPEDDTIEQICVWGTYLDASAPSMPTFTGAEQYDCTGMVEDSFRVRVYEDYDGLPGGWIAESYIAEWDVYRKPVRSSGFESLYGIEMQAYTLFLDPPITGVYPDALYWLEVANDTSEPQGNTCNWHWAVADDIGNGYCAGGTEDGYIPGSEQSADLAFCLGAPWGPVEFLPPDPPLGGCCLCDSDCLEYTTHEECEDELGGIWNATDPDCMDAEWWCIPELGDNCETDSISISDGIYPFDTACATTDGPETVIGEQGLLTFGKDIWFEYTATSTGWLQASLCAGGIQYDAAIAVYHDFENPTQCPCSGSSAYQVGPASDEGCNGIADKGAGIISGVPVLPGECWLIRVGGTGATAESVDSGRGILEVLCEAPSCFQSSTPQPERLPLAGDPISEKVRYVSFSAGDSGRNQALRVRLTSLPPPFDYLNGQDMWVGEPRDISESPLIGDGDPSPPPPLFTGANLQCTPYFRDWSELGIVHVSDDEIVPSATYTIQVIDDECELTNEADYSAALTLTTSAWGDVVGTCVTNPCGPPDGVVNVTADVVAILDKFKGLPGAPIKARMDLYPAVPNGIVNFDDIVGALDAFKGHAYPPPYFDFPSPCPGSSVGLASGSARWTGHGLELTDWRGSLKHRRTRRAMSKDMSGATEPGPLISLVPVSASGSHQINGNEITLAGGNQTVALELYVSEWDDVLNTGLCCEDAGSPWTCDWGSSCSVSSQDCGGGLTCVHHPRLRVFQAQIDSTGYSSGQSGTLTPGSATQDTGHSDWVFSGIPLYTKAVSTAQLDYAWGGTAWLPDAVEDPGLGSAKYFGTLELYVPADAGGTFTVGFNSHDQLTYVNDIRGGVRIPGLTTTPALITIPTGLTPPGPEDSGWGDCVEDRDCPPNIPCVGGTCYVTKNRYISFVPGNPGKQTALRVTLAELPENFDEFVGQAMWVGEPRERTENSGKLWPEEAPGYPTFWGARLECSWHCRDWSAVGLLHVTDAEIVPEAVYHVQAIDCAADPQDEGNYTAPLVIPTGRWGDVCGKKGEDGKWFPPDGEVIIPHDVTAVLDKFKNLDDVLMKARSDVEPNIPEWKVNIVSDVSFVLDAFRGCPYPAQAVDPPPGCPVWPEGPTGCP